MKRMKIHFTLLVWLLSGALTSMLNATTDGGDSNLELIVCESPINVDLDATGPESVVISWQAGATENSWEVQYGPIGFDPLASEGTIIPATENVDFQIDGLTSETSYQFYVRSVCDSPFEYSDWVGPVEVVTYCSSESLDYFQSFSTILPSCWSEAGSGTPLSGPQLIGESDWISDDFMDNNSSDAARLHLHSNVDEEWLLSPFIEIMTEELCEVSLDFGVKEFLGSASSMGSDDEVKLLLRIQGETSWTTLWTWDSSFESPANGQNFSFDVTSYSGQTVQFAIWATDGEIDDPENNKVFIDNFSVQEVETCPQVSGIATSATDPYSADIIWQVGGVESLWNVQIGAPGYDPETDPGTEYEVLDTPLISFDDLSPGATYEVYVQSVCIDGEDYSQWTGPFTFTTPCGVEFPEYLEDFTFFVPNCWFKAGNGTPDLGPSQFGAGSWVSDFYMEDLNTDAARMMFNSNTSQEWLISPEIELTTGTEYQLDFDFGVLFADDETPGNLGADDELQVLISLDDADSWSVLSTIDGSYTSEVGGEMLDFNLSSYEGETVRFALWGTDGDVIDTPARTVYVDNFRVREVPSCPEPADLSYFNVSITTVNLSWEVMGGESEWTVSYGPPGYDPDGNAGTEVTASTNSNFQLSDLVTSTNYDVYVRAVCAPGEDVSLWDGPVSFETLCQTSPITEYPYYEGFDEELPPAIPCGWWDENTNGDLLTWETSSIYGNSEPNALFIRYNDVQMVGMDDWVFSPELVMTSAQTYTLTFEYKTGGQNFSENFGVFLCESDDSESIISELVDFEGISNLQYQTAQVSFQVDTDGSYHIGFHGYSDPGQFYIALDDVQICDVPVANLESDAESIESLPYNGQGELNSCYTDNYGGADRDKFYTFTAPDCADSVDVSLCNSVFDTRLSVLDSNGDLIDTSDNAEGCGLQSLCSGLQVIPGEQYTVVIEGVNGAVGSYELEIDLYQTFDDPSFTFESGEFCIDELEATAEVLGTPGGQFTGSNNLVIDPTSGVIDLMASGVGIYSVTYTTGTGPCASSQTKEIEILPVPSAVFLFPDDTLCVYFDSVLPDVQGDLGGVFTSASGLSIDTNTGAIDPGVSDIGSYEVIYEVEVNGCSSSSVQTIVIDACAGVDDLARGLDIEVYPNPASDRVYLNVGDFSGGLTVKLFDLSGKKLVSIDVDSTGKIEIDLPYLSEGIYVLKIQAAETVIIKKLLINR